MSTVHEPSEPVLPATGDRSAYPEPIYQTALDHVWIHSANYVPKQGPTRRLNSPMSPLPRIRRCRRSNWPRRWRS